MIATLAGQGLRMQVPRHTAFTCLCESRRGGNERPAVLSRRAGPHQSCAVRQNRKPQRGSGESGSSLEVSPAGQIKAGLMWSRIRQMCRVASAFPPNST